MVYNCQSAVTVVDSGYCEELVALAHDGGSGEGGAGNTVVVGRSEDMVY